MARVWHNTKRAAIRFHEDASTRNLFDSVIDRERVREVNQKPYGRAPAFDGATFDAQKDYVRLKGQLAAVYEVMSDGCWRTLSEIKNLVGGSEAGISARLRDLRKQKFGSHRVNRRRREHANGLWEYQLIANK